MAINKYMRSALKALANVEIDIKTDYKLIRQIEHAIKKPHVKLTYQTSDYFIDSNNHEVCVRIFTPTGKKIDLSDGLKYPVIIFFHGGGWVTGDLDSYEKVCMTVAKRTCCILAAVDYRLAPENPFPSALEDCYSAVKAILQWRTSSGITLAESKKVVLMGDSAGGNLAAAVSLYMRDKGEQPVNGQILIYPAVYNDYTETSPFPSVCENGKDYPLTSKRVCDYIDLYCSNHADRESPYFAPLLTDNYENQPDTLILTAQYDLLRDEAEEYGKRLESAGNYVVVRRIKDAMHGYFSLPASFTAVQESYEIINKFLGEIRTDD